TRAIDYFKRRGVSGKIAKQFGLGYAPAGWRNLASVFPHYDDPILVESGLLISSTEEEGAPEKRYDRFRDRVMFPIRNIKGECIGFGGRVLGDDKPKYLNSPETPVFSKGRELYGLFEARAALREQGYVLVTEGYMDVVALAQLGFPNTVATLGTACTNDHVHKLFRFTDAVVFSFDGDAAGQRAARKALDACLPYATDLRSIKFLFLPTEHDPDSYIRAHGKDAFARYVSDATPLSRFLIDAAQEGGALQTAEDRAHFAARARPLWTALPEGALKIQVLGDIAALAQLSSAELSALWHPVHPAASGTATVVPKKAFAATRTVSHIKKTSGRARPASRADHAARILLGNSLLWTTLSSEDHSLLCELPEPHGQMLSWMEAQLHEHGPLTWSALRTELQGHALEPLVLGLMADPAVAPESVAESGAELRDLLNRLLIERIKEQETRAIAASAADPAALIRYRELLARRMQIEKAQSNAIISG
ncbi:MAG: toprim domain-containing protein, partial [Rhodoferax sp.]|nr:toprim domain-containing protein [Rhodoferax sp.]